MTRNVSPIQNPIHREVNSLASRTKESVENLNNQVSIPDPRGQPVLINGVQVVQLTTRLNKVKVEQEMASTKKSSIDLDSDDFLSGSSSVKTEIASLSSQVSDLLWIINHTVNMFNVIYNPNILRGHSRYHAFQVFTLKTTVFELSTDLTGVKIFVFFVTLSLTLNFYHININFALLFTWTFIIGTLTPTFITE